MSNDRSADSLKMKWALLIAIFLLLLLVAEVSVRVYDKMAGREFLSTHRNILSRNKPTLPFRTFGFDMYQEVEGVEHLSSVHKELYPLQKDKDTFRILCFGGSTTANWHCVDRTGYHYPLRLQAILREHYQTDQIEVINVGNSAYTTAHSFIALSLDALSWQPDLIILSHNINDLTVMYWPNMAYDYSNKYSHAFYMPNFKNFTIINSLFQYSNLYWVIKNRLGRLIKPPSLQRVSYGDQPTSKAIHIFKRNLLAFAAMAQSTGAQVLLATQALQQDEDMFLKHMAHKPYNSIVSYPLHEEFVKHHRSFNRIIQDAAKESGALFIDNDASFKGEREYFVDYVHYTPQGVDKLAHNYARFLIDHGMIARPKPAMDDPT